MQFINFQEYVAFIYLLIFTFSGTALLTGLPIAFWYISDKGKNCASCNLLI